MLPFTGGQTMSVTDIVAKIDATIDIEGITLLGGEPLAHAAGAAALSLAARQRGLSVMVFTGYTLAEAQRLSDPAVAQLLSLTDLLVDGPYVRELPERRRRWVGSANQEIHFLTERYSRDDPCWQRPNTLEIRLQAGTVVINGFPAPAAVGLWKREKP
jgi:anaerobic ribonucleoside-triphosphate reductase activating protein